MASRSRDPKHVHVADDNRERGPYGFAHCVAVHPFTDCNPASHGGVIFVQVCVCGAERRYASNGRHQELGPWTDPV